MELDKFLIHLSEPGKIHTKVVYREGRLNEEAKFIEDMLPQMAGRIKLVTSSSFTWNDFEFQSQRRGCERPWAIPMAGPTLFSIRSACDIEFTISSGMG